MHLAQTAVPTKLQIYMISLKWRPLFTKANIQNGDVSIQLMYMQYRNGNHCQITILSYSTIRDKGFHEVESFVESLWKNATCDIDIRLDNIDKRANLSEEQGIKIELGLCKEQNGTTFVAISLILV